MKVDKGLILMTLIFIFTLCFVSFGSATVTTTLNSPEDNYSGINEAIFNCSAQTDSGYLTNISLFTNSTGSWVKNITNLIWINSSTGGFNSSGSNGTFITAGWTNSTYAFDYSDITATTIVGSAGGDIAGNIGLMLGEYQFVGKVRFKIKSHNSFNNDGINHGTYQLILLNSSGWSNYGGSVVVPYSTDGSTGIFTIEINQSIKGIKLYVFTDCGSSAVPDQAVYYIEYSVYNSTTQTFPFNLTSNTLWNCLACDNNSLCSFASSNYTVNYNTELNSISYNSLGYETGTENYMLNITPIGYTPSNVKLVYNGTSYSITPIVSGSSYIFNKTLQIPSSLIGTNTFYYIWNTSSTTSISSENYTQTISPIQMGLCNASLTVPYLNFTFKDESTNNWMNATIPTSTFEYYLGDGSITKTFTYSQTVNKSNYQFCFLPANKTYYVDSYIQYKLGTDYPQRIYDPDLTSYTNSTTNKTLYLLSSAYGISSTFQVVNSIGQTLSNVNVQASREMDGVDTIFAKGLTGGTGTITFWLNQDFITTILFSKTGYSNYIFNEAPTQTFYTIRLGSELDVEEDYRGGISISKTPSNYTLFENSEVDFTFTLTSSNYALDNFTASLFFGNNTLISTQLSSVSTGDTFSWSNINVTNQSIYLTYNWSINSSVITGNTLYWINSGTQGRDFSIWKFFTDFSLYTSAEGGGLFGLDEFGKGLIAILLIILIAVGMSYRYGIGSEPMILGMIFGVVLFIDSQGFISKPTFFGIVPLDSFVTIITGILFVGFILKEELR